LVVQTDRPSRTGTAKIAERIGALLLRADIADALADWEAREGSDSAVNYDEGKLNLWYQERDEAKRRAGGRRERGR
jgi:hypothetical protein